MTPSETSVDLHPAQRDRLKRFATSQCVDIHCHCLPGLDDGPKSLSDAIALCRALVADGVTTVIATPHQLGRYHGQNDPAKVRAAVAEMNTALVSLGIPLDIRPGADVRIDERLCELLATDQVLTLADTGKYVLLELPHEATIKPNDLLKALIAAGRRPILSHPERNAVLSRDVDSVIPWLENGALLQVTAGSLTGFFGTVAQRIAWHWLGRGQAQLVATDAHDSVHRKPVLTAAIQQVAARLTHSIARRVFIENPLLVLQGIDIPVRTSAGTTAQRGAMP